MERTNVTVAANVKAFIIPNKIGYVGGVYEPRQKWLYDVAALNNIDLTGDDRVIELWITSEQCENMVDHIFTLDGVAGCPARIQSGLFPAKLFEGKMEGDELDIAVPMRTEVGSITFRMHMTLRQLEYRYRSFGSFEEAFELVK